MSIPSMNIIGTDKDLGSIHVSAEISFLAESFGTVPKLWLRILARKNLPKLLAWNFMPKFRAEILSQNTSTVPKLLAQNFGIKNLPEFSA